jgi:NAD-dependent aldehyde dehydrogenases
LQKNGIKHLESGIFYGKFVEPSGKEKYTSVSPVDGHSNADFSLADRNEYDNAVRYLDSAFEKWNEITPPKRGDIIRAIGDSLKRNKTNLGALVSLEAGKTIAEGEGEIQEMIDIAYFASGLSRQLYGLTMTSERKITD